MKQTKLLTSLFIGSTLLLFTACGGGSSSGKDKPKVETAKNVTEAKKNFKALGALSSMDNSLNNIESTKLQKTSQKTQSHSCSNGGSASYTQTGSSISYTFSSCKEGSTFADGTMTMTQSDNEIYTKIKFKNLTIDDGQTKITSTNFIAEDNSQEHWSTLNGDLGVVSKCFTGNFDFETVAKLYDAQDGTDNLESGVLKLNGATYTFANPYVTIKAGSQERTLLQSELEKEMNNSNSCSE